jgi:hypothetical protein
MAIPRIWHSHHDVGQPKPIYGKVRVHCTRKSLDLRANGLTGRPSIAKALASATMSPGA